MLGGAGMSRKQYHRQKKLMGFQKGHQKDLNRHGQELAMDMWNQTNYGAQVDHMKKAGLNPALMYGSAGQGGSTNAGSGGSAQSGQAPQERVMDMSNMLVGAQVENLKKDIDVKDKTIDDIQSQIDKRDGIDTKEGESRIGLNESVITNNAAIFKEILARTNDYEMASLLKEANIDVQREQVKLVDAQVKKTLAERDVQVKVAEMDYTETSGRNMSANLERLFSGQYDVGTYIGAVSAIASLAVLKNPLLATRSKTLGKAQKKVKELYPKAVAWFKKTFGR
jgi:hypothetical protein